MEKTVLLVDDDEKLRNLLTEYLSGYGFQVLTLGDGSAVVDTIDGRKPDVVILDVMMPGKDGIEVLRDIRADNPVPVIMLTARGDDADRIVGLELGADDYLPKPFNPRELLARIRAVLRRSGAGDEAPGRVEDAHLEAGGLVLNPGRRTLMVQGAEIELSSTEFRLIRALMTRPGRVFTRDELMQRSRGRDHDAFDRSIDVHVSNLRAKLKPFPGHRNRIKTVWGSGYMFEAD